VSAACQCQIEGVMEEKWGTLIKRDKAGEINLKEESLHLADLLQSY
jgi:hypothetical protein